MSEQRAAAVASLIDRFPAPVLVGDASLLKATVGFTLHRGVIAVAERNVVRSVDDVIADAKRLLVLESINDIENLGAIFRNAAAFGVDGVLLDPTTADPLYRRTIRVSLGHALRVPFARYPSWPDPLSDLAGSFDVVALTPNPPAEDLRTLAPSLGPRVALLLGSEGPGLSASALSPRPTGTHPDGPRHRLAQRRHRRGRRPLVAGRVGVRTLP